MRTLIIFFLALGVSVSGAADEGDSPEIQSLMTPEDYSLSGLDKLSDAEREHLSEWVARYREGAVIGPSVPGKKREEAQAAAQQSGQETTQEYPEEYKTKEQRKKDKKVKYLLVAKVIPAFTGWSGNTVFALDNGQVWRQRTPGSLRYSGTDYTIEITQNMLGKFVMKHLETGRAIGVRRID